MAAAVVLPEPCRPTIMMTLGVRFWARTSLDSVEPKSCVSSSSTMLHNVLGGRQGVQDLGGHAASPCSVRTNCLTTLEVDVCLEKRHADLAHGEVDVVLGQTSLAAQLVEGVLEAVGERVEHALHPFTNERGTEVMRVEGLQVVDGLAHADAVDGQAQLA